jgi:CspA family cold shock protein
MNKGTVKFYNTLKGFGFIRDDASETEYYVNAAGLKDTINETDKVSFDLEAGKKGKNAVNVKVI